MKFDVFGGARADAELGTLYLTAVEIDRVYDNFNFLGTEDRKRLPSKATEHLTRAISDIEYHFSDRISENADSKADEIVLTQTLFFKANVNLLSAVLFFTMENYYRDRVPSSFMESALRYLPSKLESFPEHLTVEWELYNLFNDDDDQNKWHRIRRAADRCSRVLEQNVDGPLTELDVKVIQLYQHKLLSMLHS